MPPDVEVEEGRPRPPRLLRLPPDIRHRIYLYTGVARFDGHACIYYLDGRKESRRERSVFDPPPTRNFAGLLLSCRTLYTETATLLYSANRFVIFYTRPGSLTPLRALSPTTLASLTSLKIVLNESSCHQPTDSHNYPLVAAVIGGPNGLMRPIAPTTTTLPHIAVLYSTGLIRTWTWQQPSGQLNLC
jgi:hypothetical protein